MPRAPPPTTACNSLLRGETRPYWRGQRLRLRQAEVDQGPVDGDLEPPLAVEEEQEPQRDEHDPARYLDQHVAVAEPAERSHRPGEREAGDHERSAQPERVGGEQHRPLQ